MEENIKIFSIRSGTQESRLKTMDKQMIKAGFDINTINRHRYGTFFYKFAQHKAAENGTFWSVNKLAVTFRNTSGQSCEEITISALTQLETCGARSSGRTVWLLNYFSRFFVFLTVINKRFGPFYFLNNVTATEAKRATPQTLKWLERLCSCDDSPALRRSEGPS